MIGQKKDIDLTAYPVELQRVGRKVLINNGHHRLVTLYLRGFLEIKKSEYILIDVENYRRIVCSFLDLVNNLTESWAIW
jgi:hypothetical protein